MPLCCTPDPRQKLSLQPAVAFTRSHDDMELQTQHGKGLSSPSPIPCPPPPPFSQAFYLAHVDESLALAVPRANLVVPTAPIALPPPPPRGRHGSEEPPPPPDDRHRGQQSTEEEGDAFSSLSGEEAFGVGFGGGEEDGGGGCAPLLNAEEAWRYCCNRRPDFPAMFAVYRHFRIRR